LRIAILDELTISHSYELINSLKTNGVELVNTLVGISVTNGSSIAKTLYVMLNTLAKLIFVYII